MKKALFAIGLLVGCISLSQPQALFGADQAVDECSKELLLAYFPETFVIETLKKFNVPENKWPEITRQLSTKDKAVIATVEEKAAKLDPNPLKDPQQRQAAVKLFRDTLFELFSDVLKANGVTDEKQIQAMLDDIQQQKAKRFAMCLDKQKAKTPMDDDDSDDDDDDDDSDDDDDDDDSTPSNPAAPR